MNKKTLVMDRYGLFILLVSCVILRLVLNVIYPNIWTMDELYQVLEPAHRMAFGYGVQSWEWLQGIRSCAFPGFLAGIMWLVSRFSSSPMAYMAAIYAVMVIFSCIPIVVTYGLVRRKYAAKWALLASLVPAFWYECTYFSARTLNGVLPAYLFILAAYLAWLAYEKQDGLCRRWLVSGFLFGIAAIVRFHLSPEIVFVAVYCCRQSKHAWLVFLLGFALSFVPLGMLDWLTWQYPFQSIIKNIDINIFDHVASQRFGVSPFYFYIYKIATHQLIYFIPFIYFSFLGAKKNGLLAGVALINLLIFSLIGHKEYRFVFLAIVIMTMLAGIGLATFMQRPLQWPRFWFGLIVVSVLLWIAGAVYYAHSKGAQSLNLRMNMRLHKVIADRYHGHVSAVVYNKAIEQYANAYTFLHYNIPLYSAVIQNGKLNIPGLHGTVLLVSQAGEAVPSASQLFCIRSRCAYELTIH